MKLTVLLTALLVVVIGYTAVIAQEAEKPAEDETKTEPVKDKKADEPIRHRLFMMDGSVITGVISVKQIEVQTQYGKLTVPITDVRKIVPGLNSHPDYAERIDALIKGLGSNVFEEREKAQQDLLTIGPRIQPLLEKYENDQDTERRTRIRAILNEFEEQQEDVDEWAEKPADLLREDQIVTRQFTITGKVLPKTFKIESTFGSLTVQMRDLKEAKLVNDKREPVRRKIDVDGNDKTLTNWKNTGIRVQKGDKITIKASGQINLTPWGSNAFSTPDGRSSSGWFDSNRKIYNGCLMGRIGKSGDDFKVGSKHTFVAPKSGRLELAWAMQSSYLQYACPGEYEVRIEVEPGE